MCRAWQLMLNLPMQPSTAGLAGLQAWVAGLQGPVPEGVSTGLVARQKQALANTRAWGAPVCSWLLQQQTQTAG